MCSSLEKVLSVLVVDLESILGALGTAFYVLNAVFKLFGFKIGKLKLFN